MVNEILIAISGRITFVTGVSTYAPVVIYLDKKGELTTEDIDFLLPLSIYPQPFVHFGGNVEMERDFGRFVELARVIKKYNAVACDYYMNMLGMNLCACGMTDKFFEIFDMLNFDMAFPACLDKWTSISNLLVEKEQFAREGERYVKMTLSSYILKNGNAEIYERVKSLYKKDDIVFIMLYSMTNLTGLNFFRLFVSDQDITGDEMICYTKTGEKISVYKKFVEIYGQKFVDTHFAYLAPRPVYPIIKMIPDVGRVTLLDETHATVQNLTATGLVEKEMIYEIIDDTIKLSPEHSVTAKW